MIRIQKLNKSFPNKQVLSDIDLTIEDRTIFGLVGINGAGKSTLLRLIAGVLKADSGSILLDGQTLYENEKAKRQVFFLADEPFSTPLLTPDKLKELYSTFYRFDEAKFAGYLETFGLKRKQQVGKMSKGMKRQLYLALALSTDCKVFLLDEAFDGLDPLARLKFKRIVIEEKEAGKTFILSSHSLRELEDISDSFAILDGGNVKQNGNLLDELGKLVKFQLAFEREMTESEIPFPCVSFKTSGRVVTVVARGEEDALKAKLEEMNPLLLDVLPIDFEEFFISEVGTKEAL